MNNIQRLMLFLALLAAACGSDSQTNRPDNPDPDLPREKGNIKGDGAYFPDQTFSFAEIEETLFVQTGEHVEWNGVTRPVDGRDFLSLRIGGACGRVGCGERVTLVNAHESSAIRAIITIPLQYENTAGHVARQFTVRPGERKFIGCSQLCSGEKSAEIPRVIVVAELLGRDIIDPPAETEG